MLKKTPLYNKHKEFGAKIVPFAGFEMPIYYKSIVEEVLFVRKNAGLFDVSHMGEIEIWGEDRIKFTDFITTNSVKNLMEYQVQYSTMLYEDGGIVDDLLVYRLPDYILLVVNASNTEKDYEWILKNKKWNVEIRNRSDEIFQIALQGPDAEKIAKKIVDIEITKIPFYWSSYCNIKGEKLLISRTGYTGEDGFEIYGEKMYGEEVWDIIIAEGKEFNIQPIGLGARDTLRLEMRYCLYGNDIDKTTTPLEAGLGWVVKIDKGDFIGKEVILKQKERGVERKLVCIELDEKKIARNGYEIYSNDEKIGNVTSGNWSPSIEKSIALGYVKTGFSDIGRNITIKIRNEFADGMIVKPPFYKGGTHK